MKILVTGGAGFIGSNLVERLLKDNHEVVVIDNLLRGNKIPKDTLSKITFHEGDICDAELVMKITEGCDIIFHLAAILGVDIVADNPVQTMDVEVVGMRNTTKAAIKPRVHKLLYATTSGISGHSTMESAVSEELLVDPRTSYAMAKRFNEIYLKALYEEKNLSSIAIRFFNVYGYRQDDRMVIPRFFKQASSNEPITVFGTGKQTRDFTFIDDTIEACIRLMENVSGCEIVNVANENENDIEYLAKAIKSVTSSDSEIKYVDASKKRYDYEVERRFGSSEKLYRLTDYKPTTPLEEGLKKTFDL
jgi:UDP-glucose 4-epimerase